MNARRNFRGGGGARPIKALYEKGLPHGENVAKRSHKIFYFPGGGDRAPTLAPAPLRELMSV